MSEEYEDTYQSLIDEFESETQDIANAQLQALIEETAINRIPKSCELRVNLEHTEGEFLVTNDSFYRDRKWVFQNLKTGFNKTVHFNHLTIGANELKRALTFYVLPEQSYFGSIKSYASTYQYSLDFRLIEKYVLEQNFLCATRDDLKLIDSHILNKSLDLARNSESKSNYTSLFRIIKLWISLSNQQLLPEELEISVSLQDIDTIERPRDIIDVYKGAIQPWESFTEEEIRYLMEYALFWTEKAIPALCNIKAELISLLENYPRGKIQRNVESIKLEQRFDISIDGNCIMSLNKSLGHTGKYKLYHYSWLTKLRTSLDHIRNSVFIFIALVTGCRASELAAMTPADIFNDKPDFTGKYWIRVTRWKTSSDPNYKGEVDVLPLPKFVAESALEYLNIRKAGKIPDGSGLFLTNHGKGKGKLVPAILTSITEQLSIELPIDRIYTHRFRKTIAEILINRDERNIDIIRALFGHKSYAMTLQYIARNPIMVRSISLTLEQSFTSDFHAIVTAVQERKFSGEAGDKIFSIIKKRPDLFIGKQLKLSLAAYVAHLLSAGEPLFISRTSVGAFCLTLENYTLANLPPCIRKKPISDTPPRPDPTNCQPDCKKIIMSSKSKTALADNIDFFSNLLDHIEGNDDRNRINITRKISTFQRHLSNLNEVTAIRIVSNE